MKKSNYSDASAILKYWLMNFLFNKGMLKTVPLANNQKSFKPFGKMKKVGSILFFVLIGLAQQSFGQLFWNGASASWTVTTDPRWGTASGGPYTTTWISGSAAVFNVPNSLITGATTSFSSITANENVTVAPTGTLATGGTVATINVASGKTFDFGSQNLSTAAGTGYNKTGAGTLAISAGGNAYAGGFTLNAGTVIVRGIAGMGTGGVLTLNGGIVAANATRDLTGKYAGGIVIGGNIQFGEIAANNALAAGASNLTFSNNMSLGASLRTLTLGGSGTMTFGGIISNAGGGITYSANANGTGLFDITGIANTYTGTTTITGGVEARFTNDGSFGNAANLILIDGGMLSCVSAASLTISSTHNIQVGASTNKINTTGGGVITYNGVIANKPTTTGTLNKTANGTLVLGGACTYTGLTTIGAGTIQLNRTGGTTIPVTNDVTVASGGTLKISTDQTLNNVTLSSTTSNLVIDPGATLTITGALTYTSTFISGGSFINNGSLIITGTADGGANVMTGTGTVTVNGSFATSNANGFNGGASTAIANTITTITLGSSSIIDYKSVGSQTITAFNYINLTNSGNGARVPVGTIGIGASFTPGTGLYTIGTSTFNYSGSANITSFPVPSVASGANYYNVTITGSGAFTMVSSMTIGNDLTINGTGGNFRVSNAGTNTLTVNGNVIVQNGTLTGNGSGATGASVLNVLGTFTQSGGTVNINNATVGNAGTFSAAITGTLSITAGTFNLISNSGGNATVTVGGAVSVNTTGTDGINFETGTGSAAGVAIFQANSNATFAGTSTALVDFGGGTLTGNEFRIKGNFSKSGTGTFFTSSSTAATGFVFNGTGTLAAPQTFSYANTNSDYTSYTVNTGTVVKMLTNLVLGPSNTTNPASAFTVNGTLDCSDKTCSGGGTNETFDLNAGATLATANTNGVFSTTLGSISNGWSTTFASTANYIFNGTASQTANFKSATPQMSTLTIDNSAGIVLSKTLTVNVGLVFTNGKITTGAFAITLGGGVTSITGAGSGKYIYGKLTWNILTGSPSKVYEIGDASFYTPVTVLFHSVSGGGTLTGSTTAGDHGLISGSGINSIRGVNRYWTMTNSGITFNNYDITLTFINPTDLDPGVDYNSFSIQKYDGLSWAATTTGIKTSTSTQALGLTSFSDFIVGEACTTLTQSAGTDQSVCGSSATLAAGAAASGATGTWSPTAGLTYVPNVNSATATVSGLTTANAGNINVLSWTISQANCSVSSSVNVTAYTPATVSAGGNQGSCSSGTPQMNGSFGGSATSATWSTSGTGTFNNNNPNAFYTPSAADISAGSVTITYTTDDPAGPCNAVSDSKVLTINPQATVSAGGNQTICESTPATMSGSFGGSATSATWTTSGTGTFNNNNPNAIYTPSAADISAGSVTITYTTNDPAGPCPSVSNSMTLTISQAATVSAGGNQGSCSSGTPQMNGSFGGSATSATWSTSGTGTFNNNNPNAFYTPSAADIAAGSVTITYTTDDPAGPCIAVSDSKILTINPEATVSAGGNQTICSSGTPAMSGSFGGGATSATWSTSGTGTFNNNNPNAVYTPSAADILAGSVTITYTTDDPAGPCPSVSDSKVLTIDPAATVSAGSNQAICVGPTVTMAGSFGGGATSATWSTSGTGTFNNNNPNAVYTPSAADIAAGSVTITYTTNNPAGPCPAVNASMILTLNSIPSNDFITSVTGPTAGACSSDVYQMTANSTVTPGVTYSWTTGTTSPSSVLFSNAQAGPFTAGPFATTGNTVWAQFGTLSGGSFYNVCAKSVNSCGSSTAYKCQSVRGIVGVPGTIIGSSVACPANVISYSCGASGGATIYNWTLAGSPTAITSGQGTTNVSVTYPTGFTTGQLCVNASLACGGSSTSAPRCMTVANAPLVPGAFTSGPSKVCPGATNVLFTVPASNYASGYNWTVPVGTTIVETPPYSTSIHINFPASYTGAPPVCVYATSSCATSPGRCKTVGTNIPGQPGSMSGPVNNACNATVQYSVSAVTGATSYTWTIPAGGTNLTGQGTNAIQFDISSSFNTGQVSVTANTSLCSPGTSTPRTITINGKPATPGTITASPPTWCVGATNLNFSVASVTPLPTYNWTVSNGTITTGQGTNSMTMNWGAGTGTVNVNAANSCGGSSIKSQSFASTCREEVQQSAVSNQQFAVYPNPAHDNVTVSIVVKKQTSLKLELTDISGRVILSENLKTTSGLNTFDLNLNQFSKGVYLLGVQLSGKNWKTKVVIE